MNIENKIIPLHLHPLGFIESFLYYGADLDNLLEDTCIDKNMFSSQYEKISYKQQKQLIKNGIRLCNKPGIGLLIGLHMDWSYNGTIGSVVHCSQTLESAISIFYRYVLIAQPYYAMYAHKPMFYVDANSIIVETIEHFGPNSYDQEILMFELEYRLAILVRLYDLCGNKSVEDPCVHVHLTYGEPAHSTLYDKLPCTSVSFSCEQFSISSHHSFVYKPWRLFRNNAFDAVVKHCEEEFQKSNIEATLTEKLRWFIRVIYFYKPVTLEKVANLLSMTPRTLTRKLFNEGTNFRKIHGEVRMELTAHHLRSSKLTIDEIASLMGFSCTSSLYRAVKNSSGSAVNAYRKKLKSSYSDSQLLHQGNPIL